MKVDESGSNDEACLQKFDNLQLLHPEILQEEDPAKNHDSSSLGGANKQDPVLLVRRYGSSSSGSSEESLIEIIIGNESRNVGFTSNPEEEHKDEHNTSTMDIPAVQTMERNEPYDPNRIPESVFANSENLTSGEWSTTSNESLFSIHPKTNSYRGDQASPLGAETHKEIELQKSKGFTKSNDKIIGEESQSEEKEASQKKQDEAKPPNAIMIHSLNPSLHSDGSEGSNYSFTFPILVLNVLQSSSTKGETHNSRKRPSRGNQSSNTRQRPPSPHKRTISCFCFSCHSCFSCCSCDSCCTHLSCCSCFTLPSCKSCSSCCTLPSCKYFSSCCTHPSCKSCSSCCCTLQSSKSYSSCCTLPSCQSCLSYCNFPSCYSCCTHLSCRSCCTRLSCHSCFTCPSCKKCSCLSCWPFR